MSYKKCIPVVPASTFCMYGIGCNYTENACKQLLEVNDVSSQNMISFIYYPNSRKISNIAGDVRLQSQSAITGISSGRTQL